MFTISREQLEPFGAAAEEGFERRLADHLRRNHHGVKVELPSGPTMVGQLPEPVLRGLIRAAVARGRRYGLLNESSISAFVVLTFVVAPNFDDQPAIRRVLTDDNVAADWRVNRLWVQTSPRDWEEAKKGYDPGRWLAKEGTDA
jgi:hypothetical protein